MKSDDLWTMLSGIGGVAAVLTLLLMIVLEWPRLKERGQGLFRARPEARSPLHAGWRWVWRICFVVGCGILFVGPLMPSIPMPIRVIGLVVFFIGTGGFELEMALDVPPQSTAAKRFLIAAGVMTLGFGLLTGILFIAENFTAVGLP